MSIAAPVNSPIFVDATGQRASIVRRVVRAVGALLLVYAALVVGSFARLPGADRVSLPGVGHLFPSAVQHPTPALGVDATPVVATQAVGVATPPPIDTSPAAADVRANPTPDAQSQVKPVQATPSKATPSKATPVQATPAATPSGSRGRGPDGNGPPGQSTEHTNNGVRAHGDPQAKPNNNGVGHGAGGAANH